MISNRISIDRLCADPAVATSPRMQRQRALAARLRAASPGFAVLGAEASDDTIGARFRRAAARVATKTAVRSDALSLTYAELDALADRVMRRVLASTGGANVPVVLLCGHGPLAVAGILGVLKAGAAYVALDPTFPARRNRLVLEDSGTPLLFTDRANLEAAAELAMEGLEVAMLGPDMRDERCAAPAIAPDRIATIVYTSGSTGRPKGVVHSHRTLLEVARRYTNSLGIGPEDRQLLVSSLGVTASLGNLFSALLAGATLLPFDLKKRDFRTLSGWIRQERATVYHSVASVFRHWCRELTGGAPFPDLRLVRLGGDLAYAGDFELFRRHFPHALLVNGYGCSEMSSVFHYILDADSDCVEPMIPVGYPCDGVEAYLEPRDDGTSGGEIVLAGEHLALGYWGRPDLTERAFVADGPLRTYRTGDLGSLSSEGCLLHAGRVDSQVKLNGFRVETADVEATLRASQLVADAAVVVEPASARERRLIAFVVFADEHATVAALEAYLRDRLPAHMIPAAVMPVDRLPWTPNGKLDRAALAQWSVPQPPPDAPLEGDEAMIYRIWSRVLETDAFGIDDNFFQLGGTSLHVYRILGEIQSVYGVRPQLRTWWERPTVRALAAQLRAMAVSSSDDDGARAVSWCAEASPLQVSLWMIQQLHPGTFAYDMTRTLRIRGPLDAGALERALAAVVARHGALRTVFEDEDGRIVQRVLPELPATVARVDRCDDAVEVDRLVRAQARTVFDLTRGPLFRATLIRTADDEHVLAVTVHHIVCDAWSFDILLRDLFVLYASPASSLAPAPQFLALCHGAPAPAARAVTELPIVPDYAEPVVPSFEGARHRFVWNDAVATALRRVAREESATPFAAILALFAALLVKYGARDEVTVGCAAAGRTQPDSEEAIGLFARVLLIPIRVGRTLTFRELLRQVQGTLRGALADQDASAGTARVVCVHRTSPVRVEAAKGLEIEPFEIDSGSSKYDLTLFVSEAGGQLSSALEYRTDLFDPSTIEAMAAAFETLASSLLLHPDQPLWSASAA
jgi:amino acid adenylation domain-containing protein